MISPVPRIAIPEPTSTDAAYNQRSLPQYIHAVRAAGGIAIPIALHESPTSQARILASCSAILLPGSPADVDPTRYGQEAVPATAARDVAREAADDLLLRDAFAQEKPVLGICFGLQSLNVWRRGSLIQDLPQAPEAGAAVPGSIVNHEPGREVQNAHPVLVTPGSRLSRLKGGQEDLRLSVNSRYSWPVFLFFLGRTANKIAIPQMRASPATIAGTGLVNCWPAVTSTRSRRGDTRYRSKNTPGRSK